MVVTQPYTNAPPAWMARGRCVGIDPGLMYPADNTESPAAQQICRGGCPVRRDCLVYAIVNNEEYGVWGGYSERERRNRRRMFLAALANTSSSTPVDIAVDGRAEPSDQ